jgi:hypothetical protein
MASAPPPYPGSNPGWTPPLASIQQTPVAKNSVSKGKAKYPPLGPVPPEVPHCAPNQVKKGNNVYMHWWDCVGCHHRIVEYSLTKNEWTYFAVPPCPLSPNYVPDVPIPKAKMMTVPPLARSQMDNPQMYLNPGSPPAVSHQYSSPGPSDQAPMTPQARTFPAPKSAMPVGQIPEGAYVDLYLALLAMYQHGRQTLTQEEPEFVREARLVLETYMGISQPQTFQGMTDASKRRAT